MKALWLAAVLALSAAVTPTTMAQQGGHNAAKPAASAAADMTDGEVRRLDKARGTVVLRHGEIRNLNMGAMTMSFKLQEPTMASQLAVGDKVKFSAIQKGEDLIVTAITKTQ